MATEKSHQKELSNVFTVANLHYQCNPVDKTKLSRYTPHQCSTSHNFFRNLPLYFFTLPDYQFIIKLCIFVTLWLMILCSFTIQSPNAAAAEFNILLGNSLLASPFKKLAMAAVIVVFKVTTRYWSPCYPTKPLTTLPRTCTFPLRIQIQNSWKYPPLKFIKT